MKLVELVSGPWHGRTVRLPETVVSRFALGVDQQLQPILDDQAPFAFARFLRCGSDVAVAMLTGLFDQAGEPVSLRLVGGPLEGKRSFAGGDLLQAGNFLTPVWRDGVASDDPADLVAVAIYAADDAVPLRFHFQELDEDGKHTAAMRRSLETAIIRNAVAHFYAAPNDSAYSRKPTENHPQTAIQLGHRQAEVDELLAPLILALWKHEIETFGSCQGGEGERAYIGFAIFEQGERLYDAALKIGLDVELVPKQITLASAANPLKKRKIQTANLLFWKHEILRLLAILDGWHQSHRYGIPPAAFASVRIA